MAHVRRAGWLAVSLQFTPCKSCRRVGSIALLTALPFVLALPSLAQDSAVPSLWTRTTGVDWPTFLGPTGDSKSPETGILTAWPESGLRIVWQKELGESYGIGSVSRGRYFQFDRHGNIAQLFCLNAETGKELWKFEYPSAYEDLYGYNGGPRCSPVVDGDRVYLFGAEGMLHCLRVTNGEPIWKVDTSAEFGVIQNFFGVGSTPVIEGDLLLVMVGGSPPASKQLAPGQLNLVDPDNSGIVAFDKRTGKVVYKTGDNLASYASLKLATIGQRRWCFAFMREGLIGFDPKSGAIDFEFPWRARSLESVNASTPVVVNDEVFVSETYGPGSSVLRIRPGGFDVLWKDNPQRRAKSFQAHWNTPIYVDGYLYGCSGRNPPDASLRCIEWKSGKVMWDVPNRIRTSLMYVDNHFVCLAEDGVLSLFKANPDKFEVVAEVTMREAAAGPAVKTKSGFSGLDPQRLLRSPCWAAPILSHGLMYIRGDDRLLCLELIANKAK